MLAGYVARRLVGAIPVLLGVSLVVFLAMQLVPGDIAKALLGPLATQETVEEFRHYLGLDRPLPEQYVNWLWRALHGDLGRSFSSNMPVTDLLVDRLRNSAILLAGSLVIAIPLGIAVGLISAIRRDTPFDRVTMGATLIAANIPTFVFGLGLVILFAVQVKWFPVQGMVDLRGEGGRFDLLKHLVLPAVTTAIPPAAIIARMVRSTMLETMSQEYIKAARANGLPERTVTLRYALRNALPPIVTISGLQIGFLLGGAVFTEYIFAWPGVGDALYKGILSRDIAVVQGAVLVVAVWFVLVNLAVDVINLALDPRARG
ncbi:MAG: ABC transporter permease [Thermomicrobiales bacterium]|nr:ABC transporter permease [Thermomicrobiales bacterium]